jgi:methylmalonyl-CoA/ethylmalonyl-CoA epimerase
MGSSLSEGIKISELFQAGIVVNDIDKSMELYSQLLGIDSWLVFTIDDSICRLTYRGSPSQHSFKAAMAMVGPLMIELLQPLEGTGIYEDFLREHGEGLHHLGHVIVPDLDEAVRVMEQAGFPCIETGEPADAGNGNHKWAYVDTTPALGYILEFSQGTDPRDSFAYLSKKRGR